MRDGLEFNLLLDAKVDPSDVLEAGCQRGLLPSSHLMYQRPAEEGTLT